MYNTNGHWISHVLSWVVFSYTWYSEDSIPQSTDTYLKRRRKKDSISKLSLGSAGLNKTGELAFLHFDFIDHDLLPTNLPRLCYNMQHFPQNSLPTDSLFQTFPHGTNVPKLLWEEASLDL